MSHLLHQTVMLYRCCVTAERPVAPRPLALTHLAAAKPQTLSALEAERVTHVTTGALAAGTPRQRQKQ